MFFLCFIITGTFSKLVDCRKAS